MNPNLKNIVKLLLILIQISSDYIKIMKPNIQLILVTVIDIKLILVSIVVFLSTSFVINGISVLLDFFDVLESLVHIQNKVHFLNVWVKNDLTYFTLLKSKVDALKYNVDPNDILSLKDLLLGKQNSFSKDLLITLTPVIVSTLILTGVFILCLAKTYDKI